MNSQPGRLDIGRLQVFLAATRAGNYTAAARTLNVTQSAISHAIRKLEKSLGRSLIEWQHRRLTLSNEGEYLREVCERVFSDLDQAQQVLSTRSPTNTQVVTIGATVEFGTNVLVRKLRPLLETCPWLQVHYRFSDDLESLLLRDEIDLAIDCAPHTHRSVMATRLFREKYLIVASPVFLERHPVRRPIDLENVPVLSLDREGTWWTNALRSVPGRARPVLRQVIEVNQVRGMVHAALEGYGVALLPKYTVQGKVSRGDLIAPFSGLRLVEDWFCVYQKRARVGREKNRVLTDFLLHLDVAEFGDAIRPLDGGLPRQRPAARRRG